MKTHNLRGFALLLLAIGLSGCDTAWFTSEPTGQVNVNTIPEGATIICDGVTHQESPITLSGLSAGTHLVIVRKEGFREQRNTVSLMDGQKTTMEFKLEPIQGLVLVHSDPPQADVEVDGAFRGRTPLLIPDFPLGVHRVRINHEQYLPREVEVDVKDRTPQKVDVALVSDTARVTFSSKPPGAAVLVDGVERGRTPYELPGLSSGEYKITFKLLGYFPYEERVTLKAEETRELRATLKPMPGTLTIVSFPEKSRAFVNSIYRGETPVIMENLKSGTYRIRVERPGYDNEARTVVVNAAGSYAEEFRLIKNSGLMVLVTEPAGVKVFIDGKLCGTTQPSAAGKVSETLEVDLLTAGSHTLQLSKKGYSHKPKSFIIEALRIVSLHEKLERLFIPDTRVRIGRGADEVFTGVLVAEHPNGAVELEVSPGIIMRFEASDILKKEPIKEKQ